MGATPQLPEDTGLRSIAEVLEANGALAEVWDPKWRVVYITTEMCRMMGIPPGDAARFYGLSPIVRNRKHSDLWGNDRESRDRWGRILAPIVVHDVPPDDPDFDDVFGHARDRAAQLEPSSSPPLLLTITQRFPGRERELHTWTGDVELLYHRILDESGSLVAVVEIGRPALQATLAARFARGEQANLERIGRLSEPARRPAAILFADLEASGAMSRRLSSRAYFELIRSLTDLIDDSVTTHGGITGKHAGDGASALFVVEDGDESIAASGAISAAREIRAGAGELIEEGGVEVRINIGVHWGATLMVGQVSAWGRLEVTALGDEMNEAARIESVASAGAILASKPVVERLEPDAAAELGIDQDSIAYRPLSDLGAEGKSLRDAGTIAVAEL